MNEVDDTASASAPTAPPDDSQAANPSAPIALGERRYWPFIIGGGLAVIAPFLSWVHVVILGSLNQFQLLNADRASELWALVPLGLGLWAGVQGERHGRDAARFAMIAGIVVVLADGIMLLALEHDVRQAYGLASTGIGPWAGVGGGLVLVAQGLRTLNYRA